jgi:hypothetical protein
MPHSSKSMIVAVLLVGCTSEVRGSGGGGAGGGGASTQSASSTTSATSTSATSTSATSTSTSTTSATATSSGGATPCDPTQTATDPHNCGACGHDCLGGACAAGACQPLALAQEGGQPWAIALDATHVYWLNTDGTLKRVPKNGGPIQYVTAGIINTGMLQVLEGQAYFTSYDDETSVWTAPVTGGGSELLGDVGIGGVPFAVDATSLYWSSYEDWPYAAAILKTPRLGGPPVTLVASTWGVDSIATDGGDLFWTVSTDANADPAAPIAGALYRLAAGDAAPVALYTSNDLSRVLLDADQAYVVYSGTESEDWNDGAILAVPRAGGPMVTLAAWPSGVSGFAADATNLYFTTSVAMTLSSMSKLGGPVTTLATTPNGNPTDLAVDDLALYWVDPGNGTVNQLAK